MEVPTNPLAPVPLATVHLSPHAPLCEGLDIRHHDRWPVLIGLTPAQILRNIIQRLERRPQGVRLMPHADGTCDVLGNSADRPLLAVVFDVPPAALVAALVAAHEALVSHALRRAA